MALDEALLDMAIEHSIDEPLVRVYRWSRPAMSVGRHQRVPPRLAARCLDMGVDLVRRPTGGTAVLHGKDVTYSVVAPRGSRSVIEAYCWVAAGLIAGFARLGLEAEVARHHRGAGGAACFASSLGADLTVSERKICGSAQLRRNGWLLQHGSIPLEETWNLTCRILDEPAVPAPAHLLELRPGTRYDELECSLVDGFTEVWGPPAEDILIEPALEEGANSFDYPLPNLLAIL